MKAKVQITNTHICNGVRGNHKQCALALAIRDTLNLAVSVSIGARYYSIGDTRFYMPQEVQDFVADFDWKVRVKPTMFVLELPETTDNES